MAPERGSGRSSKKKKATAKKTKTAGAAAAPKRRASPGTPDFARVHVWQIQAVRDVLVVAAVVALFWAGYVLRAVTVPLLVALLLAYLVEPIIERLCRRPGVTRIKAVSALLAGGGLAVAVLVAVLVPLFVGQTTRLITEIEDGSFRSSVAKLGQWVPQPYHDEFTSVLDRLPGDAGPVFRVEEPAADDAGAPPPAAVKAPAPALTEERVVELIDERLASASPLPAAGAPPERTGWARYIRGGAETVARVLGAVVQFGLVAFLIPFYFFFFSLWYLDVVEFGRGLIPRKNKRRTLALLAEMDRVVAGFVRGRIVISIIMGLLLALGWMACGVPYGIVLGLVTGIFCAVPYLGTIGLPVAVGLLIFKQLGLEVDERTAWWWVVFWPTVVFGAVQVLEGYVLTPKIAGKATNLDPVTILVAVLAGGSVLGVYGMLLAIPLAACGKILLTEMVLPQVRDWTEGRAADPLPIDRA